MPRFFVDKSQITDGYVTLTGDDARHISYSLRMAAGESIQICDGCGTEYDCVLEKFGENVNAKIVGSRISETEPPFYAVVWQGLPKGDKLDTVIQKSVECGASEIRVFTSEHCIMKTSAKDEIKKNERRQKISKEAAKQSGRGIIPKTFMSVGFESMVKKAADCDLPLFCYEGEGTVPLHKAVSSALEKHKGTDKTTVSVVVGPEGGFSAVEAETARLAGLIPVGLGKRILRTETAAQFVLSALVYETELK